MSLPIYMVVEMPDLSEWAVPVLVIAKSRAQYYAGVDGISFEESLTKDTLPLFVREPGEIKDWASNNMNWNDVKDVALQLPKDPNEKIDYQEGWVNGEKRFV